MDTSPSHEPPTGDDHPEQDEDGRRDDLGRRERAAVEAATAERMSRGVRRDAHGELTPEPYPDREDPGDSTDDVIELHRRQADRLEHQPDVPRADE